MTKAFLILLLLPLVMGCAHAVPPATQPSNAIAIGMPLRAALNAVKAVGGRETAMDMAPPESKHGGFATLKCIQLADGRVVCLVADEHADSKELVVVEMTVCDKPNQPKAKRDWRKVGTLELRKQPTSQPATGGFRIKCKIPEDRVTVSVEDGSTVFSVTSAGGIGGATIERKGDAWPKQVVLRLNLKGLEMLEISNGKTELSAAVGRWGVRLRADGRELGGKVNRSGDMDPLWMNIQSLDTGGDEGRYFRMVLPNALLDEKAKTLTVKWIDHFRG